VDGDKYKVDKGKRMSERVLTCGSGNTTNKSIKKYPRM
jgi:hypothetical protein